MKPFIRLTSLLLLFTIGITAVRAESFEALRSLASGSAPIQLPTGASIEGVVISDYRSMNTEHNPNISHNQVDLGENLRTAYVQSPDGRYGFRLRFTSIYENRLTQGSSIRIDLSGCELTKAVNPERYTIDGLGSVNIKVIEPKANIPVKKRHINELTDEDIYTLVTIGDVELANKHGAYTNIYEVVAQRSSLNAFSRPFCTTDGWASLLKDANNNDIYLLANTKCTWRRGSKLPAGIGSVTGIVVHTPLRRYGGDMGKYSIRPREGSDIALSQSAATSSYVSVAEWNWNDNASGVIRFEQLDSTLKSTPSSAGRGRILPDIGSGFLSTNSGSKLQFDSEYDIPDIRAGNGMRKNGALRLNSDTKQWYELDKAGRILDTRSVLMECSTEGLTGRGVCFDFSFVAGNHNINCSWGFPVEWKLEYATNGGPFTDVGRIFILRPIVYTNQSLTNVGYRLLCYDAALGFTEYSVPLPASLLGCKNVVIKLSPASARLATIPDDPSDESATGSMTKDFNNPFVLRLGYIALKVLK